MKIKLLRQSAKLPTYGSREAAGMDLYTCDNAVIKPGQTVKVGTGIAIQLPYSCFGGVFARSGLATKEGLRPANCVGIVDRDYTGEIMVALYNDSSEVRTIKPGDRIAQLVVIPYRRVDMEIVDYLDNTDRGDGGFGSTGRN